MISADPKRGLTVGWRPVDVHSFFILPLHTTCWSARGVLPLAIAFSICRNWRIRWFGFFFPMRTPATTRTTIFLHLDTRVGREMRARGSLRIGRRRRRLTKRVSHTLRRAMMRRRAAAKVWAGIHGIVIPQLPGVTAVVPRIVPSRGMRLWKGLSRRGTGRWGLTLSPRGRIRPARNWLMSVPRRRLRRTVVAG